MKFLFALILTFSMAVNAYASAREHTRICCASEDCPIVQCLAMGCLTSAAPMATHHPQPFAVPAVGVEVPAEAHVIIPARYAVIWTPPD